MMSNLRKRSEWGCQQLNGLVSTMLVDLWNRGMLDAYISLIAVTCLTLLPHLFIRYHYNVADNRLLQHIQKGNEDGLFISSVASSSNLWALIMDAGTGFTSQVYELSHYFLHKVSSNNSVTFQGLLSLFMIVHQHFHWFDILDDIALSFHSFAWWCLAVTVFNLLALH